MTDTEQQIPLNCVRINIRVDGTKNGISFGVAKEPNNTQEWIAVLEDLVNFLKAPEVPDEELF